MAVFVVEGRLGCRHVSQEDDMVLTIVLLMFLCLSVGATAGFFLAALMAMSAQTSRELEREERGRYL